MDQIPTIQKVQFKYANIETLMVLLTVQIHILHLLHRKQSVQESLCQYLSTYSCSSCSLHQLLYVVAAFCKKTKMRILTRQKKILLREMNLLQYLIDLQTWMKLLTLKETLMLVLIPMEVLAIYQLIRNHLSQLISQGHKFHLNHNNSSNNKNQNIKIRSYTKQMRVVT